VAVADADGPKVDQPTSPQVQRGKGRSEALQWVQSKSPYHLHQEEHTSKTRQACVHHMHSTDSTAPFDLLMEGRCYKPSKLPAMQIDS
jgi:hypothetical protein